MKKSNQILFILFRDGSKRCGVMRKKLIEVFSTNLTFFFSTNKYFDLFHIELISHSLINIASTTHILLYSWRQKYHSAFIGFNPLVIKAAINPIMENCLVII